MERQSVCFGNMEQLRQFHVGLLLQFLSPLATPPLNRVASGEIILPPNRTNGRDWSGDVLELARKHELLMMPLGEVIQMENGQLQPTPEWNEYKAAFCKLIEKDLPSQLQKGSETPLYEFRKKGQIWVIRFAGEEMYLKDSVGLRCIGKLLAKPNAPVFVMELRAILEGQNPENIEKSGPSEDVVDQETLAGLKRRYLELQSDLEDARQTGNEIFEKETEEEMESIVQYLCKVKAKGGEVRKISDNFEKARSATSKAFWRSVNLIRDGLPQLATHLEKSCVVGVVCNYAPEKEISWTLKYSLLFK